MTLTLDVMASDIIGNYEMDLGYTRKLEIRTSFPSSVICLD
jgi:hypothetical protein